MPVILPTTQQINDRIISDGEGSIGQNVPILQKAFIRVLAKPLSGIFLLFYRYGAWLLDQIFVETQTATQLIKTGNQFGISPTPATAGEYEIEGTGTNGSVIYTGENLVGSNGFVYSVLADGTVAGGSVTVDVLALTTGTIAELIVGDTLNLISPVSGIDSEFTVTAVNTEPEDAETDDETIEAYRDRVAFRFERQPQGGAQQDYINWALEVSGITRAFAFRTAPGVVTVYPLEGNEAGTRIPSGAKLAEVQTYITGPDVSPFRAETLVDAMTELSFVVEINSLVVDTPSLRDDIEDAISDYMLEREPQLHEGQKNLKNVVSKSEIIAAAVEVGAQSLGVTLTLNSINIEKYTLGNNELAILGGYSTT